MLGSALSDAETNVKIEILQRVRGIDPDEAREVMVDDSPYRFARSEFMVRCRKNYQLAVDVVSELTKQFRMEVCNTVLETIEEKLRKMYRTLSAEIK